MVFEIISGLWIGNINDLYDEEFYNNNNINIVINCTKNQGFLNKNTTKIRIPFSNNNINNDIQLLKDNKKKILDFIYENISEYNIFICCYNGITISPLIVALFMIEYGKISLDDIRDIFQSKCPSAQLNIDLTIFN